MHRLDPGPSKSVRKYYCCSLPQPTNSWQGPYEVVEWVGDTNYRIKIPNQGIKLFHVNLLKNWQDPAAPGWYSAEVDWDNDGD